MSNLFIERAISRNRVLESGQNVSNRMRNCRQKTFIALLLVLLAVVIFAPMTAVASDPFVGKIVAIDSGSAAQKLFVVRIGKKGLVPVKVGDTVFNGDTVKTGPGVKAQIVLADESVINIGADSTLRIKALIHDQAAGKRSCVLKTLKGTIRFFVSNVNKAGGVSSPWHDSYFAVETPVAVADVAGTEFVASINPDGSVEVAVFEGNVSVRNSSLTVQGTVTVARDQLTHVQRGTRPVEPVVLTDQRRNFLESLTTLKLNTGQTSRAAAQCDNPSGKYTKEDAARDLAAGNPVSAVLNQAAGCGMTINQMVAALVSAGVDPGIAVFTAIQEGYSAEAVVAAAIKNGASLDTVVAAAIAAGGDISAVVSGATQAGASPADVATAVANAASSTAPVFGYSIPTEPAAVPGAPASLSDGGGAQPASPSKP